MGAFTACHTPAPGCRFPEHEVCGEVTGAPSPNSARRCSKRFQVSLTATLCGEGLLLPPLYRKELSPERLNSLPRVTQPATVEKGF